MNTLILILAIANFSSFLWSVISLFKTPTERLNWRYRILQISSVLLWVTAIMVIVAQPLTSVALAGLVSSVQAFCLVAFWLNSKIVKENEFTLVHSPDIPVKLVQRGLFRWIRHPFYAIYLLCYFSIGLAYRDPIVLGLCMVIAIIYYQAARSEEAKFAKSALAAEYNAYKSRSYMFFPKFWGGQKLQS